MVKIKYCNIAQHRKYSKLNMKLFIPHFHFQYSEVN